MQEHFRGQLLTALCVAVPGRAAATPFWVHSSEASADINLHSKATVWQRLYSLPAVAAEPEAMRLLFSSESKWGRFKCPNCIFCMYFPLPSSSSLLAHLTVPSSEALHLVRMRWTNGPWLNSLSSEAISSPWKARKAEEEEKKGEVLLRLWLQYISFASDKSLRISKGTVCPRFFCLHFLLTLRHA